MSIVVFGQQRPPLAFLTTTPKLKSGFFKFMVRLVSRIDYPADPIQFPHKRPGVHIAVIHGASTALPAKVIIIFPLKNRYGVVSASTPHPRDFGVLVLPLKQSQPDQPGPCMSGQFSHVFGRP